jgi:hypothetical protein
MGVGLGVFSRRSPRRTVGSHSRHRPFAVLVTGMVMAICVVDETRAGQLRLNELDAGGPCARAHG